VDAGGDSVVWVLLGCIGGRLWATSKILNGHRNSLLSRGGFKELAANRERVGCAEGTLLQPGLVDLYATSQRLYRM
jgi:hypothetical protein